MHGITLTVLVITLAILLILAGTSISIVAGRDGVMSTAEETVIKTNNQSAKKQIDLKMAQYQDEYFDAMYSKKTITATTKMGDWIFATYGNKEISTGDFTFIIEGSSAPYKVTILKDSIIRKDVIGSLSAAGKISWE